MAQADHRVGLAAGQFLVDEKDRVMPRAGTKVSDGRLRCLAISGGLQLRARCRGSPPFVCALGGIWSAEYDFDVANRSASILHS
jgi:hypothetical protein